MGPVIYIAGALVIGMACGWTPSRREALIRGSVALVALWLGFFMGIRTV